MIVVADTSPINYLVLTGWIDLLPALFGNVYIPLEVMRELQASDAPVSVRRWANSTPPWLIVSSALPSFPGMETVDPGEREAIQLALDHHADKILLDDLAGRQVALAQFLQVTGTIGIFEDAEKAHLASFAECFHALEATNFRFSASLRKIIQARHPELRMKDSS